MPKMTKYQVVEEFLNKEFPEGGEYRIVPTKKYQVWHIYEGETWVAYVSLKSMELAFTRKEIGNTLHNLKKDINERFVELSFQRKFSVTDLS